MRQNYPLHIFLFLVTVFTTLMAGTEWVTGKSFFSEVDRLTFDQLWRGIPFSFAFLGFLTVHEFGHYLTAMYHKVRCTLPYYIPIFIPVTSFNIGSFGAVIRIREIPSSRRKYFDIGVAGPLAGFVVALGLLIVGFTFLPSLEETVFRIHPNYPSDFGGIPTREQVQNRFGLFEFGGSLLFEFFKWAFRGSANLPPSFEMMHYPFILVGFLTLFFTALNLLPIGQLDGGHVTYGLFGAKIAGIISRVTVLSLLLLGGIGVIGMEVFDPTLWVETYDVVLWEVGSRLLYILFLSFVIFRLFPAQKWLMRAGLVLAIVALQFLATTMLGPQIPNLIWLLYSFMAVQLIGVDHPIAYDDEPLSTRQKIMGWVAIAIFILCFSPNPVMVS